MCVKPRCIVVLLSAVRHSIIILSWHKLQISKIIVMCSWLFGHLCIDGETVQMNCTEGIHVPDMKQKKNHQASNTVHFTKALLVTSGRHPSLSHTSLLGPHLLCSVLRVAHYPQLCESYYRITSKQPYPQRIAFLGVVWKLQGSTLHVFLSLLFSDSKGFLPWAESGQWLKLTIYFQLVPRQRMSGAVPPFTLCAFIAWTGKTCLFYYFRCTCALKSSTVFRDHSAVSLVPSWENIKRILSYFLLGLYILSCISLIMWEKQMCM